MDHPTRRLDPDSADDRTDPTTRRLEGSPAQPDHRCPRCQGEMIEATAESGFGPRTHNGDVLVRRQTGASLWHGPEFGFSKCAVWVCTSCGFIEWFATQPRNLLGDK